MIKKEEDTESWYIFNSLSGATKYLKADLDAAETSSYTDFAFTSTGFTVSGTSDGVNKDTHTYIYAAWA